ncbi:Cwf15 Cwc15 cell cycle control [Pyrrhoderma noxium]|uniref:Cwf15 Cwc15 cell cycle control n=1 Tax=Pyrrhoderma noxium TaxID=2282107 RepID=A0A286UTY5_9AGAM|nr:Cwf15 Cwc15 cell cycle control [Pyrrhoderma noxium]
MSTAHRPTWDPAQAKEVKGGSRLFSARDVASHTKLKFRQPGQASSVEVTKRDLRAELLAAEHAAREKKRKAEGLPSLEESPSVPAITAGEDDETNKRRKLLQEALELDKDDDDDESSDEKDEKSDEEKSVDGNKSEAGDNDDDDEDEDEDDDEDETAELLRELAKIKRERAEEKERQEQAQKAAAEAAQEERIAKGNPLLDLSGALGQNPQGINTNAPGTFAVKRRPNSTGNSCRNSSSNLFLQYHNLNFALLIGSTTLAIRYSA